MERISATIYKGLRGYWQRRGYVKLNGSRGARRSRVELGSSRRRRFWRIRVKAKLRIRSPKKFFVWLRDAYVKMMLRLANSRVISSSTGYGGAIGDYGIAAFGKRPLKEYEEKMIVEIYKSLVMAQAQLLPREAGRLSSAIICRR